MMRRMASEAVDNYFADPGKMVTTATVLQCRPVGRSENLLGTISNQKKNLKHKVFPLFLFKSGGKGEIAFIAQKFRRLCSVS